MANVETVHPAAAAEAPRGMDLLNRQGLNKGTAFNEEERTEFGLRGLLPPQVETIDEQVVRAYEAFQKKDTDLERHIYLRALQDTNEVLFYRLLLDHIEEMMPLVYTPTVALACEQFSHIYRRPRGLFISCPLRDSIPELLRNRREADSVAWCWGSCVDSGFYKGIFPPRSKSLPGTGRPGGAVASAHQVCKQFAEMESR